MATDITYAKGVTVKEIKFTTWSKLGVSFKVDEFCEFLQSIKNEKGYANLDITEKKEEYKKDFSTHDVTVNEYRPKNDGQSHGERLAQEANALEDSLPF